MNEELEATKEAAKAVQETAKTVGKALDITEKLGRFISRYTGESLELAFGIIGDKLKYLRWERQIRLMMRANEFLKKEGLERPTREIPIKFVVPLLQASSLEDDDYIQDLWAKLLVNAANEESKVEINRAYIDILERLTPIEARILKIIYTIPYEEMQHRGVATEFLPHSAKAFPEKSDKRNINEPNEEVILALANLDRLGCLSVGRSMGGGQLFGMVNPTLFGKKFVDACTLPSEINI